ncbi:DNA helicase [Dulcicalothrix desertica PCC 7102]|uniref:DNA 3'-5' helicase n=1 Tax=Dulcicalothrix desertica PCC 7102 TaxID=232991 RepID=A0A433VG63_9CYAN|nr:ATP-dependent helicase [Dulcicalothrix desertica]RUT05069.1 DNA helicase [Dulcicalothrix desertica PCC 7102]
MLSNNLTMYKLWELVQPHPFKPNSNQEKAILHTQGPLFLTAGPGSGKTRVLLWRTLNLIVFHDVKPEEIFLGTFTEKAAFQLQEGLRSLLGIVTNITGKPYDISGMYVGTIHSLCQKLLKERRLSNNDKKIITPVLKDQLGQYFYISKSSYWKKITQVGDFTGDANFIINQYFDKGSNSKHKAVINCMSLFNRFSEEYLDPILAKGKVDNEVLDGLIDMYTYYKDSLHEAGKLPQTDLSLIQQQALDVLANSYNSEQIFKHVIIDEYQDTNTIQEKLVFKLASGHNNICVVGDDDQALYRFRGATVENFVDFPSRCQQYFGCDAEEIPLDINYRSRQQIVDFYGNFINSTNWRKASGTGFYRIHNKNIKAHSQDANTSIVVSTPAKPEHVCSEIASLVKKLVDTNKVQDPNQIAFLYPSLKSPHVEKMIGALEQVGLKVYAPRARRFLEVPEAVAVFGIYLKIFGQPVRGAFPGADYKNFHDWMDKCVNVADQLIEADTSLDEYVRERQEEIEKVTSDHRILLEVVEQNQWDLSQPYDIGLMKRALYGARGLSGTAKKALGNIYFERIIEKRIAENKPFSLKYVVNAASSVDWSVLDLFYRLCIFNHFKTMLDLAEQGEDEGPVYSMGLITQYLARFTEEYASVITAQFLLNDKFQNTFFTGFLYSLFRLGESEHEDANDPFPKGRIPFLTIHQSKGLEFPVVVLGNPRKDDNGPQRVETIVSPLLNKKGEPLDRMSEFDIMRMFYVALSRAKNLMIIAHYKGTGQRLNEPFKTILNGNVARIPRFDINTLPEVKEDVDELPKNYSYTSDYLLYQRCPRQYMVFRKYGFIPSRSQTMFFGSVVHKTIEDLHYLLMSRRQK